MRWKLAVSVVALTIGMALMTMTMPAQTITPDEATLKLFPPDTKGVAFIDAAGLRNAVLLQEVLDGRRGYPSRFRELFEATGFKPERDIDRVHVARTGERDAVAVLHARYDQFQIEAFARDENTRTETYLGRVLYRNRDVSITLIPDQGLIVAGSTGAVKQVIDRLTPGAPNVTQNNDLMTKIRSIEVGNQVWAVGEIDMELIQRAPGQVPAPMVDLLSSLTSGTYQMRIDHDVHLKAIASFSEAEAARTTSDLLKGLVALFKFQTANKNPDMLQLLDGVRIDNSGSSITVLFDARGDLLKKLQPQPQTNTAE